MPTVEEMVTEFGGSAQTEPEGPVERTIWQKIKGEWPPFTPPPVPLTLEKIWRYVLDADPTPPSAEELAAEAAREDREYPECHNAVYRRAHPDWLEEKVAISPSWVSSIAGDRSSIISTMALDYRRSEASGCLITRT